MGSDFILQYDLSSQVIDPNGSAGVMFRGHREGKTDIYCHLALRQSSWDISCGRSAAQLVAAGTTPQRLSDRTTTVTLIARGDEMRLYLDGQPVGYGQDEEHYIGGWTKFRCIRAAWHNRCRVLIM